MKNQQGFTLIEVMIVVAILAILVAVALPRFQRFASKAARSEGIMILEGFHKAELSFYGGRDGFVVTHGMGVPLELEYQSNSANMQSKYYDPSSIITSSIGGVQFIEPDYYAYLSTTTPNGIDADIFPDALCIYYPKYDASYLCPNLQNGPGQVNVYVDDLNDIVL